MADNQRTPPPLSWLLSTCKAIISSNRVVTNSLTNPFPATIFVCDKGKIAHVQAHLNKQEREKYFAETKVAVDEVSRLQQVTLSCCDYQDMIVLPGLIDPHVNLQDLAKEQWEGFAYGTAAAAAGGVTTVVDLPMMKKPNLTSVKNLLKHIEVAQTQIKVDVAFIAYLSDDNVPKIEEFIKDGQVFGFSSYLSAPLNRKLEQISDKQLLQAIKDISQIDNTMIYYIDPLLSEGRHMFAKSPFRKEKLQNRVNQDLPNNLNLLAFAFADGNEGDNSSQSEDDAEPQVLNIQKLNKQDSGSSKNNIQTLSENSKNLRVVAGGFQQFGLQQRFQEPDSALLRHKIKEMREDVQNIAHSELMMYDNTNNNYNYLSNNLRSSNLKEETSTRGTIESEPSSAVTLFERPNKVIQISSGKDKKALLKMTMVAPQSVNTVKEKVLLGGDIIKIKQKAGSRDTSKSKKVIRINRDSINFGAVSPIKSPTKIAFDNNNNNGSNNNQEQQQQQQKVLLTRYHQSEQQVKEEGSPGSKELKIPILGSHQQQTSSYTTPTDKSQQQHDNCATPTLSIGRPGIMHGRNQSIQNSSSTSSPLMQGNSGKSSFLERRRQLMAQKQLSQDNESPMSDPARLSKLQTFGTSLVKNDSTPIAAAATAGREGQSFGLLLLPVDKTTKADNQFNNDFTQKMVTVNTRKQDESEDKNLQMQCNYQFFLSLQPVSFEEKGVLLIEKLVNQISNFKQTGCKLHLINLSSNIGLDKVRQLKKQLDFEKVSYEITPHHLMFTAADVKDKDTVMKCNPPIRDEREQSLLLISLKKRYFDSISSCHFPVDPMYKKAGGGNFFKAFNGVSTLGFSLQAVWTLISKHHSNIFSSDISKNNNNKVSDMMIIDNALEVDTAFQLSMIVEMMCERPAKMLGIDSVKGTIEVGKQADIIIFDPDMEYNVTKEDIHSRFDDVSIYKNKTLRGRVLATYLAGHQIFSASDPSLIQAECRGKVLRRADYKVNMQRIKQ